MSLEEGGYIDFDGSLGNVNAVKSFDNYLYVFCDFGIYRLTAYADQTSQVEDKHGIVTLLLGEHTEVAAPSVGK